MKYFDAINLYLFDKKPSIPAKTIITEEVSQGNQIAEGIKIEHEHLPTYQFIEKYLESNKKLPPPEEVYKHIAEDHLNDKGADPLYYTHLVEMLKKYSHETDY